MKAYAEDLAYIHDVGFGAFAAQAVPGLLRLLARNGVEEGRVVDLGCGSGIWARGLCDAGYQVEGFDISADMIRLARKKARRARFHVGSFLDVELPPCDAVTSLGECFNYLFDARNDRRAQQRLFRRIHAALRPGGVLVFDVAGPKRHPETAQRFWEGKGWAILVDFEKDAKARFLTRRVTTFRKVGRHYRRGEEEHVQRLYPPAQVEDGLRRAGFKVRRLRAYGKEPFPPGLTGFLARRA